MEKVEVMEKKIVECHHVLSGSHAFYFAKKNVLLSYLLRIKVGQLRIPREIPGQWIYCNSPWLIKVVRNKGASVGSINTRNLYVIQSCVTPVD